MYVIGGDLFYFNSLMDNGCAHNRDTAQRFPTVTAALRALQDHAVRRRIAWSYSPRIEKLTITPGSTVRREVPLGTPGSEIAIVDTNCVPPRYWRPFGQGTGSLQEAQTYATFGTLLNAASKSGHGAYFPLKTITLAGVLEETSEETLTATPLE